MGPETFIGSQRRVRVKNTAGTTAPAHAVLQVTGYSLTDEAVEVDQPDADGLAVILFNGEADIPAGGFGAATADLPAVALYAAADGTPAAGETWGSGAGSWELRKGNAGVLIWGGAADGRVVVGPAAGTGAGAGDTLTLTQQTCDGDTLVTTCYRITFPAGVTVEEITCP